MKAAIVHTAGQTPAYGDFAEPVAAAGENHVTVTAAALSPLARGRASGRHYSSEGVFPFVAGVDGVGRLDNGQRVYFALPRAPFGAMAERSVVAASHCAPLPDDLDDITAAAIANPGMSSWAALVERAKLRPGETVLINGATGASGRLAVQIARHLGAGKVLATGRDPQALREIEELGADAVLPLGADEETMQQGFAGHFAQGVDVVLDYLWGPSARALLIAGAKAGPERRPIRFVQIGSISGEEIGLPAAVLRSSAIELIGSGIGSVPLERLVAAFGAVLEAAVPAGLKIATAPVPLSQIGQAWDADFGGRRAVFTVEPGGT